MTDRHAGYVVTLQRPVREDDAETILTAIRMIKGVIAVDPVGDDPGLWCARSQVDMEWREKLRALMYPPLPSPPADARGGGR